MGPNGGGQTAVSNRVLVGEAGDRAWSRRPSGRSDAGGRKARAVDARGGSDWLGARAATDVVLERGAARCGCWATRRVVAGGGGVVAG
jgi:hypothetical protein